jgi:hypothetical protein
MEENKINCHLQIIWRLLPMVPIKFRHAQLNELNTTMMNLESKKISIISKKSKKKVEQKKKKGKKSFLLKVTKK